MSAFNTSKLIDASPSLIPIIGERMAKQFMSEGYEVVTNSLSNGGYDVSITKGGLFKAALGMRTALKVSLTPQAGKIFFDASVGIFGQQAIPTVISMFFFWPVLITQIWGLVQQSHLDDQALAIAEEIANEASYSAPQKFIPGKFCTNCSHPITGNEKFCPECGNRL